MLFKVFTLVDVMIRLYECGNISRSTYIECDNVITSGCRIEYAVAKVNGILQKAGYKFYNTGLYYKVYAVEKPADNGIKSVW